MDKWVPKLLTDELEIEVSNKPEASAPCAQTFETIGGRFVFGVENPYSAPTKANQIKWAEVSAKLLEGPRSVAAVRVSIFCGSG